MGARISMAEEERRAGDQDTREEEEEATGGEVTEEEEEEEGTQGTGPPTGSVEESSEDAERTGSEEVAPAGPEVEATRRSTVARRRALRAQRR